MELLRLSLHVIAATVWVGGQLVLAALVPALRGLGPDAAGVVARAFARVAWPAYWLLVLTGLWNWWEVRDELHGSHAAVFGIKMLAVIASGATAWWHQRAQTSRGKALSGAGTGVFALLAVVLGVQLTL